MDKKSKITVKELEDWQNEVMDLLNNLDSLVVSMKVEMKRQTLRKDKIEKALNDMEEILWTKNK